MNRSKIGCCLVLTTILATAPAAAPAAEAEDNASERIKIRPDYGRIKLLKYQLKLGGAAVWTPGATELGWSKMTTDFTFVLRNKVVRASGACTFELLGERLASIAEGPKGKIQVHATRDKARLTINGKSATSSTHNPLNKAMTITFGPLAGFRFGTGLRHVAVYMLPHIDHRFWALLTLAPPKPVAPGDTWSDEFQLPVPGSQGTRPLHLKGRWMVIGWQSYRGKEALAIALTADLDLKDSNVLLKNGDLIHVTTGIYKARGKILWDTARGVPFSVVADQKILIKSDKPTRRALRSEHKCTLNLMGAK